MTGPSVEARVPNVGDRFEHARMLDTTWRPGPGQGYANAPKLIMKVTRVAMGTVYYRPDDGGSIALFKATPTELVRNVGRWLP